MSAVEIRPETPSDFDAIRRAVAAAFENHPHSNQTEHLLIDQLRGVGALTISLVAIVDGQVVGHIAFSPVTIDGEFCSWYGLALVSVHPTSQRRGIGGKLIMDGLDRLRELDAKGCVLLGEPDYYGRFGFAANEGLILEVVPPEYFLAWPFSREPMHGIVKYHDAFAICD